LVFLIGGNGSGKTTLVKILTGLYAPDSGEIRLGTTLITDSNREAYRQSFSALFHDFYLFERLLGLEQPDLDVRSQKYLSLLQLDHKVTTVDGRLSTLDLSQGQRKRLALLVACLEDRPIYVFDEWASDQDPVFKNFFYTEMLPELICRGKTIFAISHDDHYYKTGSRLIKLVDGVIESDRTVASTASCMPEAIPR
jgi:putative ATP-binding cassette transporter